MYLWVYLFFFNTLWVWIPLWILWEAYQRVNNNAAFIQKNASGLRYLDQARGGEAASKKGK